MNVTTQIEEAREQVLDTVKAVQKQLVEWNHSAADFVGEKAPKFTLPELPFAEKIPSADEMVEAAFDLVEKANSTVKRIVPKPSFQFPEVPGLTKVPAPADLLETYFEFVEELTAANRSFFGEMVKAWSDEVEAVVEKPAPVKKAPARKAPAKRAAAKK